MRRITSVKALAEGLGTLRVLASLGPTTTREFAIETGLDRDIADALIAIFLETGYVVRIDGSSLLTVTPLALAILSRRERLPRADVRRGRRPAISVSAQCD